MTTIYLIRHAEAEGNLYRRFHGQCNSNITPNGMKQIAALAERFAHIPVDFCYSSDLIRTMTTAQAVSEACHLKIHPEPAFREIYVGVWEDLPFGYLNHFYPTEMDCYGKDPVHWLVPGGESFLQYTDRFICRMTELAQESESKIIAIVTHAGILRSVLLRLFPDFQLKPIDNTSVTKLIWDDGRFLMEYQGDGSHLPAELSTIKRNQTAKEGLSGAEHLFWFRPGWTELAEMDAPQEGTIFTIMADSQPIGRLVLNRKDVETGVITHMDLLPPWRGYGRSVQLLGQAVYEFRKKGMQKLILKKPGNGILDDLCRRMEFHERTDGWWEMDIRLQIRPFSLCTAGMPAVGHRPPVIPVPALELLELPELPLP